MNLRHLALLTLLAACGDDGPPEGADTFSEGRTAYPDAERAPDGSEQEEAHPSSTAIDVEIRLSGTGDLSGLRPECELEGATGSFTGLMEGSGTIDEGGLYSAALVSSDGTFTTPSGACEIPDLSIGIVTGVTLVGSIENTQESCETYCGAKARQSAETECAGDADEASCRATAEGEYEASCETACTGSTTRRIVAEVALGASALTAVNANLGAFGATGLGTIEADLSFDRIEEADGSPVDEAP